MFSDGVVWHVADGQFGFELLANGLLEQGLIFWCVCIHAASIAVSVGICLPLWPINVWLYEIGKLK